MRFSVRLVVISFGMVLLLAGPGMAAGADDALKVTTSTGNTVAVTYTNPGEHWWPVPIVRAPLGWLVSLLGIPPRDLPVPVAEMLGRTASNGCEAPLITYTNDGTEKVTADVTWTPMLTQAAPGLLQGGSLALLPVGAGGTCGGEVTTVEVSAGESRLYAVKLVPPSGPRGLQPGTYQGTLLAKGLPALPVAITVRESMGVALFFTLLGLLANRVVAIARQAPKIITLNRRRAQLDHAILYQVGRVDLMLNLARWIKSDLRMTARPEPLERVGRYLDVAELVISNDANLRWAEQLNAISNRQYIIWEKVRQAVLETKPAAALSDLHTALEPVVSHSVTKFLAPGHAELLVRKGPPAIPARLTPPSVEETERLKLGRELAGTLWKPLMWYDRQLYSPGVWSSIANALFGGVTQLGPVVLMSVIFCAALLATLLATAGVYGKIPTFGADPMVDFGAAFAVGYAGKVLNDSVQKIAPGLAGFFAFSTGNQDDRGNVGQEGQQEDNVGNGNTPGNENKGDGNG